MERRDFTGAGDLRRMQALAQRLWGPGRRFHPGDLAWGLHSVPGAEESYRISLWERGGSVVGWAWAEAPGYVELLADPAAGDLVPEMLDWFEAAVDGPELTCLVMSGERHVREVLAARGYQPQTGGPFFTRHDRDLARLPAVALPAGFTVEAVTGGDAERRAAVHRAGWSDLGSRLSAECYAALMRTYPYRPETDLVVVSPEGEWVASALGWYDEVNAVGLVEPVSVAPGHRGLGLARAVDVALLRAFRDLGGSRSVVLPRGDDGYPAPGRLYRSIGYRPGARTVQYSLSRPGREG